MSLRDSTLFLSLLFISSFGYTYEIFPEYRSLTRESRDKIERPGQSDGEFQSDVLTFSKSFEDEVRWLSADSGYDMSIGSLGSKNFYDSSRLKLKTKLVKEIEFRLTHFEQADFDHEEFHTILELIYWLTPKWGISVYGEPSYHKAEDDIGMAILFTPAKRHEWRFFYSLPDFSRNKRNDESDRFLKKPFVAGLAGRWWSKSGKEFTELVARFEGLTHWRFNDDLVDYRYMKRYFQMDGRWQASGNRFVNYNLSYMRQNEEINPITGNVTDKFETWLFERGEALLQYEAYIISRADKYLIGTQYLRRFWDGNLGQVKQGDLLPHIWWKTMHKGHEAGLGYEFTWHRAMGPDNLRADTDEDSSVEHRLNTSFQWNFAPTTKLKILLSFDLDRFGSGDTWEGGSGQFQYLF